MADFWRLPNPNYAGQAFADDARLVEVSGEHGIGAEWATHEPSGEAKVRTLLFDKARWPERSGAEAWLNASRSRFAGGPKGLEAETACFDASFAPRQSTQATEAELALINTYALEPLSADQVYVREMRLANDQWGRTHRRLSRGFLQAVMRTVPGKSLMPAHAPERGNPQLPIGRFFDSREEYDEATGTSWGLAKFYLVNTDKNEHDRAQIDGGVWQYSSIGLKYDWMQCSVCGNNLFDGASCPHVPGQKYPRRDVRDASLEPQPVPEDPDLVYCGAIYRGQGEALEGSIVYLSDLYGTDIFSTSADVGRRKAALLGSASTPASGAGQQAEAGTFGTQGAPANTTAKEAGETRMDDKEREALEALKAAAEQKAEGLQATVEDLTTKLKEATDAKAAFEPKVAAEAEFRKATVAELDRLAGLIDRKAEFDAIRGVAGEDLAGLPAEKVLAMQVEWTRLFDAMHPGGRQSTQVERDADGNPLGADESTFQVPEYGVF